MRAVFAAAGVVLAMLSTTFAPSAAAWEADSNRRGSDYRSIELRKADPAACQAECDGDRRCAAWTLVKPGIQGRRAVCMLKDSAPRGRSDKCCVSGLRSEPQRAGRHNDSGRAGDRREAERARTPAPPAPVPASGGPGTSRPGGDYHNFDLAGTDPQECRAACDADGRCRSWTFVRPGFQNEHARCWLKSTVPAPVRDNCCTSGAKGAP